MRESGSSRGHTRELSSAVNLIVGTYLDNLASIVFEVVNEHPLPGRHISSMTHLAVITVLSDSDLTISSRPTCQPSVKWKVEKAHFCID
jgi:hypothetical protein